MTIKTILTTLFLFRMLSADAFVPWSIVLGQLDPMDLMDTMKMEQQLIEQLWEIQFRTE
jgi:hypothetical protein